MKGFARSLRVRCTVIACAVLVMWPGVAVHAERRAPADDAAQTAWAQLLARAVDERGRIDFRALAADSDDLQTFVHWLDSHGPRTTPSNFVTREEILAYRINAYHALAMWTVLRAGPAGELNVWRRAKIFLLTSVKVDGDTTTLQAFESDVIRPMGDPRIHFALNCMVRDCPRLRREPYTAALLDKQLDEAAGEFVGDGRGVRLDPATKTAWLSSIFSFYTDDFLIKDACLIAYVNRYRSPSAPIPPNYVVQFLPYDWTVNRQDAR